MGVNVWMRTTADLEAVLRNMSASMRGQMSMISRRSYPPHFLGLLGAWREHRRYTHLQAVSVSEVGLLPASTLGLSARYERCAKGAVCKTVADADRPDLVAAGCDPSACQPCPRNVPRPFRWHLPEYLKWHIIFRCGQGWSQSDQVLRADLCRTLGCRRSSGPACLESTVVLHKRSSDCVCLNPLAFL